MFATHTQQRVSVVSKGLKIDITRGAEQLIQRQAGLRLPCLGVNWMTEKRHQLEHSK